DPSADDVEIGVQPDGQVVGLAADKREPAGVADDDVEQVPVNHQGVTSVGSNMDGILDHLDAAEMRAVIIAQKLVVVSGDVDDAGALARLAQQFLQHVIMGLRPVPGRLELPSVDDVADQVDGIGVDIAQEIEQLVGLAAADSEMNVGQEQSPDTHGGFKI